MASKDRIYQEKIEKIAEIIKSIKGENKISNDLIENKFNEGKKLIKEVKDLIEDKEFKIETIVG
jgi:hypothetical protein